jgi:hypothetical protein
MVLHYIQHGTFDTDNLPGDTKTELKNEMKRIKKRASNYRWDKATNRLLFKATARCPWEREVPPPHQRDALCVEYHEDYGHVGQQKLRGMLLKTYYWKNMSKQIKDNLKGCVSCLRNRALFKLQPELKPIPPSPLFTRVHLDSMGPYPTTPRRARYIIVGVDSTSKWVHAEAVENLDSATTTRFCVSWISQYGCPLAFVCDNGKEYQGEYVKMLSTLGIKDIRSPAYAPNVNGQAESSVKSILRALQASLDRAEDWDVKLPWVLLGLRSAPHTTTKCTPFEAAMARTPRLPADVRRLAAAGMHASINDGTTEVPNPAAAETTTPAPGLAGDVRSAATRTSTAALASEPPGTAAKAAGPTNAADEDNWWKHLPASWEIPPHPAATNANTRGVAGTAVPPAAHTNATAADPIGHPTGLFEFAATHLSQDATESPPINLTNSPDQVGPDLLHDIQQRAAGREKTLVKLEKNILASQEKQKRDFRKRHHVLRPDSVIQVGELCLMKSSQYTKMHKKLATEGPFYLVAYSPDYKRAVLQDNDNRRWSVSVTRLAPYAVDAPKRLQHKPGAAAE